MTSEDKHNEEKMDFIFDLLNRYHNRMREDGGNE